MSLLTPRTHFRELNTATVGLNLEIKWKLVVSPTSRPLYRLEMASGTHQIGGLVDFWEKRKKPLSLTGFELRIVQPLA